MIVYICVTKFLFSKFCQTHGSFHTKFNLFFMDLLPVEISMVMEPSGLLFWGDELGIQRNSQ